MKSFELSLAVNFSFLTVPCTNNYSIFVISDEYSGFYI
jgi:hypothetical protein